MPSAKTVLNNKDILKACLLLVGETGNGKSSLGNFILGTQAFSVSDNPESETKITCGQYGVNENQGVFVIDTPGLNDSNNRDKEHLLQMVDYIKSNPELQAIVIVLNFHQPRLPSYIQNMIKLLCNIFPGSSFWDHVALVWSKCDYYMPEDKKRQRIKKNNTALVPKILDLVRETTGDNSISSFPTFYIDSDFEQQDPSSIEEVCRLIAWTHSLKPIDVTKVKVADPVIKETIEEEDVKESVNIQGNVKHIKREYFKRNKNIGYNGEISFTNWEKVREENEDKVLPKELIKEEVETKEEKSEQSTPIFDGGSGGRSGLEIPGGAIGLAVGGPIGLGIGSVLGGLLGKSPSPPKVTGYKKTVTVVYYERINRFYNDGSVEHGPWNKVDTKTWTE